MVYKGEVGFSGKLTTRLIKAPTIGLDWKIKNFFPNVWGGLWRHQLAKALGMFHAQGRLYIRLRKADGSVINYGLVSTKVVTTAFVNDMVDEMITETSTWGDYKYHDCGTDNTAPDVSDTGLGTPYGGARSVGTQVEGGQTYIYRSVGTISFTSSLSIVEHGLFNASSGVTLLDRHVFTSIGVDDGDQIEFTYELTCTAGG